MNSYASSTATIQQRSKFKTYELLVENVKYKYCFFIMLKVAAHRALLGLKSVLVVSHIQDICYTNKV